MNKLLYFFIIFVISLVVSILIIHFLKFTDNKLLDSEYIIDYLGIFLGFTIALLSFAISITDKIKENILDDKTIIDKEKKRIIIDKTSNVFEELKDDSLLIFWFFIAVIILYIFENTNIPLIDWPFKNFFSKTNIINQVKFAIFISSLYAIYDIIKTIFILSESTRIDKRI